MNQALAALLGAIVGGLASMAGVVVTGRASRRLETERQQAMNRREESERLRLQTAETLRLMFRVEFAIYSICWCARYVPEQVNDEKIAVYERHVERLWPELSGAMVVLSSLDPAVHNVLNEWNEKLAVFAGDVRRLIYQPRDAETLEKLAGFVEPLRELYHTFPCVVGSFLHSIKVRNAT